MTKEKAMMFGKAWVEKEFSAKGEIFPSVFCFTKDKVVRFKADVTDDESKENMLFGIWGSNMLLDVECYVAVNEGWSYRGNKELSVEENEREAHKYGKIEDHPERVEVVTVMAADKEKALGAFYDIVRPTDGEPFLKAQADSSEMGGRFAELLKPKPGMVQKKPLNDEEKELLIMAGKLAGVIMDVIDLKDLGKDETTQTKVFRFVGEKLGYDVE